MAVLGDPGSLYEALGVPRTASPGEIRTAFRERAKLYHPDGGAGADEERFRRLREAYEVLRDPQRRLQYDADSLEAERRRDRARYEATAAAEESSAAGPARRGLGPGRFVRAAAARGAGGAPFLLPGLAGALLLAFAVAAGVAVWNGRDAADLRGEIARLRAELAAEGDEGRRRERAVASLDGSPPPAAAVAYGEAVYEASVTFPARSAELDPDVRDQIEARVAELQAALGVLPPGAAWFVLVDGYSGRAASQAGVAVDAWELSLLRVATVTDKLVRSALPPDRLAVRFLAGFAPESAPDDDPSRDVALRLVCCED